MNHKFTLLVLALIFSWSLLVSCQKSDPGIQAITTAVSIPDIETMLETAAPPSQVPTDAPIILATPLSLPTAIPTQPAVPIETTTTVFTPSISLTQRNPNLAEIEEFLSMTPILFFYPDRELTLRSFDEYFMGRSLSEFTEIFYKDVNGDGEDDLIVADMFPFVWSNGFVIVMLWVGDQYGTPLGIVDIAKYSPGLRVSFEDWTNDNIPEVIFDFRSDTGGAEFIETTWTRYIIHCELSCEVVWWGVTGQLSSYSTVGLITTNIERSLDGAGNPTISITSESFYAPKVRGSNLRVITTTSTVYTWNGSIFESIDEQIMSPQHEINNDSILSATGQSGFRATITSELDDSDYTRLIFYCTLHVDDTITGEPFECLPNFTKIIWQDITNDGNEEIVVIATVLGVQHLLAFQWDGAEATQIADVSGDIIRSDLFGVTLIDVDSDSQFEIVAGKGYVSEGSNCKIYEGIYPDPSELCWWHELNLEEQIYQWDGVQFVLQLNE